MDNYSLMENDASVGIRKARIPTSRLEKFAKKQANFSTFPTGFGSFSSKPEAGKVLDSERNRRSSARLRKENPRLGNVAWETRIHDQRVRQLPMNQLSCVCIDPRISD